MKLLISIEYAKYHLRVDHDYDDKDIELKIAGASDAIIRYLQNAANDFINKKNEVIEEKVPDCVKLATLQLVGMLYKDRDGEKSSNWELGYLPHQVTALIYNLRTPSIA